jgi:hypothetical protein
MASRQHTPANPIRQIPDSVLALLCHPPHVERNRTGLLVFDPTAYTTVLEPVA